jgi:hypothetical protein
LSITGDALTVGSEPPPPHPIKNAIIKMVAIRFMVRSFYLIAVLTIALKHLLHKYFGRMVISISKSLRFARFPVVIFVLKNP